MKHYKYIHIFWHDDLKFKPRIVQMINNESDSFQVEDHLFVTPYTRVYDAIKGYKNVMLFKTDNPGSAEIINKLAPYADWLFVNCLTDWKNTLRIKRKYQSKIIWRTWGHELRFSDKEGRIITNLIKKMIRFLLRQEIRRFHAVGVSNIVDQYDIEDRFGDVKTIRYPYPIPESNLGTMKTEVPLKDTSEPYCVVVGHSGHMVDNHIEVLKSLEKFQQENIRIYLLFSYGSKEYMEEVRKYVNKYWENNIIIIDRFLAYPDYTKLCAQMDAVILDGTQSYALGNLVIFLDLKKKIYLNRNGLIRRAFLHENMPHFCTDEIRKMTFEEFTANVYYPDVLLEHSQLRKHSYSENVEQWKSILASLS